MNVTKRDGTTEPYNIRKLERVLEWATEGLSGVSAEAIMGEVQVNWYDGISTADIHQALIQATIGLFTIENPNYQYAASRLLNFDLRKKIWGGVQPPSFYALVSHNITRGVYTNELVDWYTRKEVAELATYIDHERDFITYAGVRQLIDKYLVQDRVTKQVYETPQFAYMLIAMTLFHSYPQETRMDWVKRAYDAFSLQKINLPTPQLAGLRTPTKQFASCALLEIADDMKSLAANNATVALATAERYGIGLGFSSIRQLNAKIRGGETAHTGVIPFLKWFESATKSCQQAGLRGGSATTNFTIFHPEIMDILVLKNDGGTEDNRVRKLDYAIWVSKLFWERMLLGQDITLLSEFDAPEIYAAHGLPEFDALYVAAERRLPDAPRVSGHELLAELVKERAETGRIYIMNADHVNSHGSWKEQLRMTNLCVEVNQPTTPIMAFDDANAEIGVCILAAVNLVATPFSEMEEICEIMVRMLDAIIDYQDYPVAAMRKFATTRRSLGIGLTNLAGYLAKNGYLYSDVDTPQFVSDIMEAVQYFCTGASVKLAREFGPCEAFHTSKYSDGILPIDTYKREVDEVVAPGGRYDWEARRAEILLYGMRHCTLTAQMPCESSSVVSSATNGNAPIQSPLTFKGSKVNSAPVLAPGYPKWKYELAFETDPVAMLKVYAGQQKWLDMSGSNNLWYSRRNGQVISDHEIAKHLILAHRWGVKSLYYHLTDDGAGDETSQGAVALPVMEDCVSGACAL